MSIAGKLPREIAPNIFWVGGCAATDRLAAGVIHVHSSAYLVRGASESLLFDTSGPDKWHMLEPQLDDLLGDRPLDWIVPSHSELPHAGNLIRLCAKYPGARVVGDVRDYHLHFPELASRLVSRPLDTELDLGGGYRVTIMPALIKDMATTQWAYESSQEVLFVADAFAYSHHPPVSAGSEDYLVHAPGECAITSSEFPVRPQAEQAAYITKAALFWTRFVRFDPFLEQFRELMRTHPTKIIGPAHGNVITNLDDVMPMVLEAHRLAFEQPA